MENNVEEVFITTGNHVAATDYELSYAADAFVLVVNRSRDDFFKVQMKDAIGYISPLRIRAADSGGKVSVPACAVSFVCWLGPYHRLLGVHISPRLVAQTRSPYDLINYGHPSVVTCLAYAADKEKVRFPSNGRVGGKGGLRGRTRAGGKGGLRGKRVGLEGKGGLRLKVKKGGTHCAGRPRPCVMLQTRDRGRRVALGSFMESASSRHSVSQAGPVAQSPSKARPAEAAAEPAGLAPPGGPPTGRLPASPPAARYRLQRFNTSDGLQTVRPAGSLPSAGTAPLMRLPCAWVCGR